LLFKGYGAKVGLGNMRVKAENRMVTKNKTNLNYFTIFVQIVGYTIQNNYKTNSKFQHHLSNIVGYTIQNNSLVSTKKS